MSQVSDNPKNEDGEEEDDDTIIGANDLSEDSDSASGGIVGRFVGEGGETITVVERDPAWMAELRKARCILQRSSLPEQTLEILFRQQQQKYSDLIEILL